MQIRLPLVTERHIPFHARYPHRRYGQPHLARHQLSAASLLLVCFARIAPTAVMAYRQRARRKKLLAERVMLSETLNPFAD